MSKHRRKKPPEKKYRIDLYYGCAEGKDGIYHSFAPTDPRQYNDDEGIGRKLAALLDMDINDDGFSWNLAPIIIPNSVVEKIKQDAVKEFSANVSRRTGHAHTGAKGPQLEVETC